MTCTEHNGGAFVFLDLSQLTLLGLLSVTKRRVENILQSVIAGERS